MVDRELLAERATLRVQLLFSRILYLSRSNSVNSFRIDPRFGKQGPAKRVIGLNGLAENKLELSGSKDKDLTTINVKRSK